MIKIKSVLSLFSILLFLNIGFAETTFGNDASDKRDECMTKCNETYTGDSFFDGAQRSGCRLGCDIAYLWDVITE